MSATGPPIDIFPALSSEGASECNGANGGEEEAEGGDRTVMVEEEGGDGAMMEVEGEGGGKGGSVGGWHTGWPSVHACGHERRSSAMRSGVFTWPLPSLQA